MSSGWQVCAEEFMLTVGTFGDFFSRILQYTVKYDKING